MKPGEVQSGESNRTDSTSLCPQMASSGIEPGTGSWPRASLGPDGGLLSLYPEPNLSRVLEDN